MSDFSIIVSIHRLTTYTIVNLKTKLSDEVMDALIAAFCKRLRNLYYSMILEALASSRYKGRWEPTEEGYLEYLGCTPVEDFLSVVESSMYYKKVMSRYIVGFNETVKYPGSSLRLVKVLRAIEYGTSDFPARPILKKIKREIERSILRLWKGFLLQKGVL